MFRTQWLLSCFVLLSIVGCGIESPDDSPTLAVEHTEVSADTFQQTIEAGGFVLAKFGAPSCGPCVRLDVELDLLEEVNRGSVTVIRVNVDDEPELAAEYDVSGIPRSFLIQDGKIIDQWLGWKEAKVLQTSIDRALANSAPVGDVQVNEYTNPE